MRLIAHAGVIAIATRRARIAWIIAPRAPAQDPLVAGRRVPCRAVFRRTGIVLVPAVRHPLGNASGHVVETKGVRREAPSLHRQTRIGGVATALAIRHPGRDMVAPPIFRGCPSPRGVFPFRLRRQPIPTVGDGRQPRDVLLRVVPAHVVNRHVVIAARLVVACLSRDTLLPLADGDGQSPERKRCHVDLMRRLFRRVVIAPHGELSARKVDPLGTLLAFAKDLVGARCLERQARRLDQRHGHLPWHLLGRWGPGRLDDGRQRRRENLCSGLLLGYRPCGLCGLHGRGGFAGGLCRLHRRGGGGLGPPPPAPPPPPRHPPRHARRHPHPHPDLPRGPHSPPT